MDGGETQRALEEEEWEREGAGGKGLGGKERVEGEWAAEGERGNDESGAGWTKVRER